MEETKNVAGVDLDELRRAREELNREMGIETPPPETYDRPKREPVEEPVVAAEPAVQEPQTEALQDSSDEVSSDLSLDDLLNDLMMDSHFEELINKNLQEAEATNQPAPQPEQVSEPVSNPEPVSVAEPVSQPAPAMPEPVVQEPVQDDLDDDVFSNFAAFDVGGKKPAEPVSAETQPSKPAEQQTVANTDFKFDEEKDYSLDELYQAVLGVPYQQEETQDENKAVSENQETSEQDVAETNDSTIEPVVQTETEIDEESDIDDVFAKFDNFAVEQSNVSESVEQQPVIEEPVNVSVEEIAEIEPATAGLVSNQQIEVDEQPSDESQSVEEELETTETAEANEDVHENQSENLAEEPVIEAESEINESVETDAEYDPMEEDVSTTAVESSAEELTNINNLNAPQEAYAENVPNKQEESTFEMIGSYRQLEQLLGSEEEAQEILETIHEEVFEEEQAEQQQPEPVKSKYKEIESFRYVDLITTDSFKNSNNLSYVLGKNEEGDIVYGNLIDSYNVAIFGKETDELHNLVHSVLLSLILKNPVSDINFVICDSKSDSKFEVYNKSSYMYFNRIAKTNKEILDSLIELSKELEERYKLFAEIGVKSIEQYNIIAKNDGLKHLPYLLTVFNNYSKSIQLTNSDKINACLYQLLKYGRMVGIYIILVANTAISSDEINYNLPTRLSFKTDDVSRSLTTLGFAGAETLPGEEDMLYSSLLSENLTHLKVAMLTKPEIELLIENIEE